MTYPQKNQSKIKEFEKNWAINPLPLLTSEGNGRGGGDYYSDDDLNWSAGYISALKAVSKYLENDLKLHNEPLRCTHKGCKKLQTGDGEFCKKHYPKKR